MGGWEAELRGGEEAERVGGRSRGGVGAYSTGTAVAVVKMINGDGRAAMGERCFDDDVRRDCNTPTARRNVSLSGKAESKVNSQGEERHWMLAMGKAGYCKPGIQATSMGWPRLSPATLVGSHR